MEKEEKNSLLFMLFLALLMLGMTAFSWGMFLSSMNQEYLELAGGKALGISTRLDFWLSDLPWTPRRVEQLLANVFLAGLCLAVVTVNCRLFKRHFWFALGRGWRWRWVKELIH